MEPTTESLDVEKPSPEVPVDLRQLMERRRLPHQVRTDLNRAALSSNSVPVASRSTPARIDGWVAGLDFSRPIFNSRGLVHLVGDNAVGVDGYGAMMRRVVSAPATFVRERVVENEWSSSDEEDSSVIGAARSLELPRRSLRRFQRNSLPPPDSSLLQMTTYLSPLRE